jgi:RNA polymerase sigma-70 factor (ECF subfamily)
VRAEQERRFEEVVASRYDSLRRTAYVLVGDHHHAQDLAQIVFLKLHRSWNRVDGVQDLDAYLHVTLVNTARSWWKRHWHGEKPTEQLPDEPAADGAERGVDLRDAVVRALGGLGRDHREVLVLRHIAGLSEAETAEVLSCSVGTVKSRTSRALAALRESGALTDSNVRTP